MTGRRGRRFVRWAAALLVAVGLGAGTAEATEPPRALRVVTFNMLHGGPSSGRFGDQTHLDRRFEMVVDQLQPLAADIIGLQEASARRGRGNVAERLASRLGFHWVHARATERVFGPRIFGVLVVGLINFVEGPAIISRFPITRSAVHDLPRCMKRVDARVVLQAIIDTPWGAVDVFSTHTSHDDCQLRHIGELLRERRGALPSIVMGDFNVVESSPSITALRDDAGFVDAFRAANPSAPGPTVWQRIEAPERTVFRRVDYVFMVAGTDFAGRVLASQVVLDAPGRLPDGGTIWPSDHYGVLADVKLFPTDRRADRRSR